VRHTIIARRHEDGILRARVGCNNVDRWMDGWDNTAIDISSTRKNEAEAAIRRRAIPFVYDMESPEVHTRGPCMSFSRRPNL
jgi:hypothetical protein